MSSEVDPVEISKMVDKLTNFAADCFEERDLQGALEFVEKAIRIDPTNHVLYYNKAQLYAHMNSLHQCLENLKKCLEILPSYDLAHKAIEVVEKKIASRYTCRCYY